MAITVFQHIVQALYNSVLVRETQNWNPSREKKEKEKNPGGKKSND